MIKKILFFILSLFIIINCKSQSNKVPILIKLDSKKTLIDVSNYELSSYNFEYDNKNRLIKMTDSIKQNNGFKVKELLFTYNEKGRLKKYTYNINNKLNKGHNITYENNKVIMSRIKENGYNHILELDKSNKIIKSKSIHSNSYFNSSYEHTYYEDGTLKSVSNYTYEYSKENGIFSNVNMEPWSRVFFAKLISFSLQKRNIAKRKTLKKNKYTTKNYEYEFANNYPDKIIYNKIIYNITYK